MRSSAIAAGVQSRKCRQTPARGRLSSTCRSTCLSTHPVIPRDALCNKLHELGYSFKRQADRVCIYKRPGNPSFATVPRRDLLDEQYVGTQLRLAGCSPDEIEAFITQYRQSNH